MYNEVVEKYVEVVLHKAIFSSGGSVALSVVATEGDGNNLKWAVACGGRSHSPVIFF